jgi:antitoxin HigA-1
VLAKLLDLIPPGEILMEEFMRPFEISQARLARDLDVSVGRVGEIVHGRAAISAEMALRLSAYFGTTAEFWINLQSRYDLKVAARAIGDQIRKKVPRLATAAE